METVEEIIVELQVLMVVVLMQEIFREDREVLPLEAVQMVQLVQEDLVVEVDQPKSQQVVHQQMWVVLMVLQAVMVKLSIDFLEYNNCF